MKKLFLSACMLLMAAVLLGTTTYAWFSMNNQVTATGMSISAKNESGSLIIGAQTYTNYEINTAPTLTSVQEANLTSVNLGDATYNYTNDFAVKPSQHADKSTIADLNFANWSYKVAAAPDSYAADSASTAQALTSYSGYVIYYDLYITVAKGSPAMYDLKANATIQASGQADDYRDAVRVLVASDSAAEEFYNAHTESGTAVSAHKSGSEVLAETITSSALTHLRVYIYIDGEDSTVYTNNYTNLKSATISLSFTAVESNPTIKVTASGTTLTATVSKLGSKTVSSYAWYKDTEVISGATSSTYIATANGTYTCKVTLSDTVVYSSNSVEVNNLQ